MKLGINMITKEEFIELLNDRINWNDKVEQLCELLGSNLWESDIFNYGEILFEKILNLRFNDSGIDIIFWWLYERKYDKDLNIKIDGKEVPSDTLDDLWEIVKDYRK